MPDLLEEAKRLRTWATNVPMDRRQTHLQRDAELVADAYTELVERLEQNREALDAGRRFERAYQESLGATPTTPQFERLDSLQSRFLDLYTEALAAQQRVVEGG